MFTAVQGYTGEFLNELRDYGPTQSPAVTPDVIACTTYFGNGIQDWAHAKAQQQAGTSDPWFYTTAVFDPGNGQLRPVSLPATDPYWRSKPFQRHLAETIAEWRRRMLGGSASEGGGPDATGFGGGFEMWLRQLALTTFPQPKPLVAYEGGPSLYTDYLDGGDVRDDGITTFLSALNRHGGIRELYDVHLNLAKSKGLRTHSAFVDAGVWSKWGQWGHLEHWPQGRLEAPKHFFLLDWIAADGGRCATWTTRRGLVPEFVNAPTLEPAVVGQAVHRRHADHRRERRAHGACRREQPRARPAHGAARGRSRWLPRDGNRVRERHQPRLRARGRRRRRPRLAHLQLLRRGRAGHAGRRRPPRRRPRHCTRPGRASYVTDPGVASYGGLVRGAGSIGAAGDDAFMYSVNAPATESTLAQAVAENEYVGVTLTAAVGQPFAMRRGTLRFTVNRQDYHSPRRYAVFTSVGRLRGRAGGLRLALNYRPGRAARARGHAARTRPPTTASPSIQVRIYGYAANFGGHRTRIAAFKLSERVGPLAAGGRNERPVARSVLYPGRGHLCPFLRSAWSARSVETRSSSAVEENTT